MEKETTNQLLFGWSIANITPEKPVALVGQFEKRISEYVHDPLYATVLALETVNNLGEKEQAIMISCDLLFIYAQTTEKLQRVISKELPDFDTSKLFMNAIHTHTSPGVINNEYYSKYDTSKEEGVTIMRPSDFEEFFIQRVSKAIVDAWEKREPGGFSWGLGNAVLGHNRRTVKTNGMGKMYGVNDPDFLHYEGGEDSRIQLLFFWDKKKKLKGILINSCATAQVTDSENFISADFYHEVRETMKKKYGNDIYLFFQIGSSGDITPFRYEYIYSNPEEIMRERKGISARQEQANRMIAAIEEVIPYVKDTIEENVIFRHKVLGINLPTAKPFRKPMYHVDSVNPAEIHIVRLGDIVIASNPFELFLDYGLLIKLRSKATLTFIVELACQCSGYLPSERAYKSAGYSADEVLVNHEGGNKLVKETVENINKMWE